MFQFTLPDKFMRQIKEMEQNADKAFTEMVEEGARNGCEKYVRQSLKNAIGSDPKPDKNGNTHPSRSTGTLLRALGVSPVKVDREGVKNAKIGFYEPRNAKKYGGSYSRQTNAMIANVLEYGRTGQAARPWLRPVKRKVEQEFRETAERIFEEYTK